MRNFRIFKWVYMALSLVILYAGLARAGEVVVFVHGNAGGLGINSSSSGGGGGEGEFSGFWCSDGIAPLADVEIGLGDDWLGQWLVDEGYDVWVARYTSNTETTDTLVNNAACIGEQIGEVAPLDTNGKVTVIAASLGGLVSRFYLEGEAANYPYQGDVERLFTLGTPNKGMPVGLLEDLGLIDCTTTPTLCEVSRNNIKTFNQTHERAQGVIYNFVGGAAPIEYVDSDPFTIISAVLNLLGSNDGLVLTNSALGRRGNILDYAIDGEIGRFETDETHGPGIGINSYFVPRTDLEGNITDDFSTAYEACIRPQLGGLIVYCGSE